MKSRIYFPMLTDKEYELLSNAYESDIFDKSVSKIIKKVSNSQAHPSFSEMWDVISTK